MSLQERSAFPYVPNMACIRVSHRVATYSDMQCIYFCRLMVSCAMLLQPLPVKPQNSNCRHYEPGSRVGVNSMATSITEQANVLRVPCS
jgi:hypothetical protein